jgi:signal transduction histidine kinase
MKKTKILVVDDMQANLVAMEAILGELDVDIVCVDNGNDALAAMLKDQFALVLLDVQMPGMDGFETAELMGGHAKTKNTPIIFLTALSKEDKYIEKGYISGAVDYILKPINPDILRQKVKIFKTLYEQKALIESQADELRKMYEVECRIRKTQDLLLVEQSKLATMGEMFGYMTHQWRQPITITHLCFQDIEDCVTDDAEHCSCIQESLKTGTEQLMYMSHTIDDFKNYFKPNNNVKSFGACIAIQSVMGLVGAYITRNGIKITHTCYLSSMSAPATKEISKDVLTVCGEGLFMCDQCPATDVNIHGSENEFKQVIINLLNNASDALEDKYSDTNDHSDGKIQIVTKKDEQDIVIIISDNAGGVPSDLLDKIFEPYFTTKGEKGTGIGLNMVQTILEDHFNAKITLENDSEGAVFTIRIPLKET